MWYGTDDSATFWEDVVKHPAVDVLRQYEQWACMQGQSKFTRIPQGPGLLSDVI